MIFVSNYINAERPKILLPKVDVIFKLIFGDKRNEEILVDFLKSVLDLSDDEYQSISFDDPHLKREDIDDKLGIVDVLIRRRAEKSFMWKYKYWNRMILPNASRIIIRRCWWHRKGRAMITSLSGRLL